MKEYLFYLTLLISSFAYTQDNTIYYDVEQNLVTKSKFDAIDENIYFKDVKRKDSLIINFIGKKESIGKLDDIQKKQFYSLLEKITSKRINKSSNTIIHFYKENAPDLKKTIKNRKYWRWIKNNQKKINAHIICSKESKIDASQNKKLHLDAYSIVERLFLKNSNTKVNHIIIKPDGSFKIFHGVTNVICLLDSSL